MKRAICFSFLLAFILGPAFGQTGRSRPYWYTLERGKLHFRSGEYGEALAAFEEARDQRRDMYTRMEQDIIAVLSLPEVRRMGDSLGIN
jgi:hypothetical protein